jgi:hypothetical protein
LTFLRINNYNVLEEIALSNALSESIVCNIFCRLHTNFQGIIFETDDTESEDLDLKRKSRSGKD